MPAPRPTPFACSYVPQSEVWNCDRFSRGRKWRHFYSYMAADVFEPKLNTCFTLLYLFYLINHLTAYFLPLRYINYRHTFVSVHCILSHSFSLHLPQIIANAFQKSQSRYTYSFSSSSLLFILRYFLTYPPTIHCLKSVYLLKATVEWCAILLPIRVAPSSNFCSGRSKFFALSLSLSEQMPEYFLYYEQNGFVPHLS